MALNDTFGHGVSVAITREEDGLGHEVIVHALKEVLGASVPRWEDAVA